jgi:hypothetical protein
MRSRLEGEAIASKMSSARGGVKIAPSDEVGPTASETNLTGGGG